MDTAKLEAELQKLHADIEERERIIAHYEKWGVLPEEPPATYVFDFDFPGLPDVGDSTATVRFPLQQKTVQVKKNTIFKMKSMSQAYTVNGTRETIEQEATFALPQTARILFFNYLFKMHDTGSDRELQDDWVPGALLLSGNYNDMRLRKGHAFFSPGAEITIQVDASAGPNDPAVTGLAEVTGQQLQIVLSGFEIPFGEDH